MAERSSRPIFEAKPHEQLSQSLFTATHVVRLHELPSSLDATLGEPAPPESTYLSSHTTLGPRACVLAKGRTRRPSAAGL